MIRIQFVAQKLAALALFAGVAAFTPSTANALPHFGFHAHPADANDTRISLEVYNKGDMFRDVQVDGKVYTVLPHHLLTIKAPKGTPVFTNSTGSMHHKGDLLFSIDPSMQNHVLYIN